MDLYISIAAMVLVAYLALILVTGSPGKCSPLCPFCWFSRRKQ